MIDEKDLNKRCEINGYSKWTSKDPALPHRITYCPDLLEGTLEIGRNRFKMDICTYNGINIHHYLSKKGKLIVNVDRTEQTMNMEMTTMKDKIIHNVMSTNTKYFHSHSMSEAKALNIFPIRFFRENLQVMLHLKLLALSPSL